MCSWDSKSGVRMERMRERDGLAAAGREER